MMSLQNEVLFGSDLWQRALEKFGSAAHVTVKLFDTAGQLVLGPIHPTPLFDLFEHARYDPGLFTDCVHQCLRQTENRPAVMVSKVHGLTVIGTSLVLDGKIVGAAVAGYVFVDFSQVSEMYRLAKDAAMTFERLWKVAREQQPVPQSRLIVHGELLQVLGDALLRENRRTRQFEKTNRELEQTTLALCESQERLTQTNTDLEHTVNERTTTLRELSASLMRSQDDERRRISRELHDSVGQYLAHAKLALAAFSRTDSPEKASQALAELAQDLESCVTETRTISYLLHPPLLDELGLGSAMHWFVEGFSERSNIQVNLHILLPELCRFSGGVELVLFRVLQESLVNVHRHAHSASVDVKLEQDAEAITLSVRDYGQGIPPELIKKFTGNGGGGVGLRSMRGRIDELGGRFEIRSNKSGTLIQVTVPLAESEMKLAHAAG